METKQARIDVLNAQKVLLEKQYILNIARIDEQIAKLQEVQ